MPGHWRTESVSAEHIYACAWSWVSSIKCVNCICAWRRLTSVPTGFAFALQCIMIRARRALQCTPGSRVTVQWGPVISKFSPTNVYTVWHTWGGARFQGINHPSRLHPNSAPSPKFFEPPTSSHTTWETTAKFCMAIKLDERNFLQGLPRPCPGRDFGNTNADARSVCAS